MSRIDDAVTRILAAKFELGLFEKPNADRTFLPDVGSDAHRAVARRAVRESLVLLKDENQAGKQFLNSIANSLSNPGIISKIVVAGKSRDDIGNLCGGWTISWQGSSGDHPRNNSLRSGSGFC